MTVVVPRGTTARANSGGGTMLDSMWTCASRKPGAITLPVTSIVSLAVKPPAENPPPTPTIRPSAMAMLASCTSPENTLTICPPLSSRSAGASPRAILIN